MKTLTFIVGLPGSGKTSLAQCLAAGTDSVIIDDISVDTEAKRIIDADHLIVTDPNACSRDPAIVLGKLREWFGDRQVRIIAFTNDVDQCWMNVQNRADGRIISKATIDSLAKNYVPEQWGTVHSVWKD